MNPRFGRFALLAAMLLSLSAAARADGTAPARIDTGDTAWLMVSTALVFLRGGGLDLAADRMDTL